MVESQDATFRQPARGITTGSLHATNANQTIATKRPPHPSQGTLGLSSAAADATPLPPCASSIPSPRPEGVNSGGLFIAAAAGVEETDPPEPLAASAAGADRARGGLRGLAVPHALHLPFLDLLTRVHVPHAHPSDCSGAAVLCSAPCLVPTPAAAEVLPEEAGGLILARAFVVLAGPALRSAA